MVMGMTTFKFHPHRLEHPMSLFSNKLLYRIQTSIANDECRNLHISLRPHTASNLICRNFIVAYTAMMDNLDALDAIHIIPFP